MSSSWTSHTERRPGMEFTSSGGIDDGGKAPSPKRQRWLALGLTVAVVAAVVGAVMVRSGSVDRAEAIAFSYGFTPGETRTYDFRMGMDMKVTGIPDEEVPEIKGTMSASMVMTVEKVNDDGSAVVEVVLGGVSFDVEGGEVPMDEFPQTMRMKVTLAPNGEIISSEGSIDAFNFSFDQSNPFLANPSGQSNSQMFFPTFPQQAIAPGETWDETTEMPLHGDEVVEIRTEGKHLGFEDTDFGRAAKIEQKMTVPLGFEFSFGELLAGLAGAFSQGAPQDQQIPAEIRDAKMVFDGTMSGLTTSLVIPENADAVKVDGTMKMDMTIRLENFPDMPGEDVPDEIGMVGTFDIDMRRVA